MRVTIKYTKRKKTKQTHEYTNKHTDKKKPKLRERDTPFTTYMVPFVVVHSYKNKCHRF